MHDDVSIGINHSMTHDGFIRRHFYFRSSLQLMIFPHFVFFYGEIFRREQEYLFMDFIFFHYCH